MDFDDAIRAHVEWKLRLRMFLDGQGESMTGDVAARDNACELGRWLYGEGRKYATDPSYPELKEAHARFHQVAAEVLIAAERGDKRAAEARLESPDYSKSSSAVVAAIMRMRDARA
jgi:hypothetical protein